MDKTTPSTLVGLAKLLVNIDRCPIQALEFNENDDKDTEYPISINNEEYIVSDTQPKGIEDGKLFFNRYNLNFFLSTTGKVGLPRIDNNQNKNILIDEAYAQLGYLPSICEFPEGYNPAGDNTLTNLLGNVLADVSALGIVNTSNIKKYLTQQSAYDEYIQCKNIIVRRGGDKQIESVSFRYVRGRERESVGNKYYDVSRITRGAGVSIEKPITVQIEGDMEQRFVEKMKGHAKERSSLPIDIKDARKIKNTYDNGMDVMLNVKDAGVKYADCEVFPKSIKYWRREKKRFRFATQIINKDSQDSRTVIFEDNPLFVYDTDYYPNDNDDLNTNILRCPLPSCTSYYSFGGKGTETSMRLHIDPNWQKTISEDTETELSEIGLDAPNGQYFHRYAVGCKSCMSSVCKFCGQLYFSADKHAQLMEYFEYKPAPARMFLVSDARIKAMLEQEKQLYSDESTSPDKLIDCKGTAYFCECQRNLTWFYDEMSFEEKKTAILNSQTKNRRKRNDTEINEIDENEKYKRVVQKEDLVFVSRRTTEVVAAFSPKVLFDRYAELDNLYYAADSGVTKGSVPPSKSSIMLIKQVKVFFTDYFDATMKKCKDSDLLGLMNHFAEKKGEHYLDMLTPETLLDYCKGVKGEKATQTEINSLHLTIVEKIENTLKLFEMDLAKAICPIGAKSQPEDVRIASICDCRLCTCCGMLYYIPKQSADREIKELERMSGGENFERGDVCSKDTNNWKDGRWVRYDGAVFYRSKKDPHINNRTIITSKGGEKVYEDWQKEILSKLSIKN